MKHISSSLLLLAGLALAGCSSTGMSGSSDSSATMSGGGTAKTSGGAEAANADVKGSTSATGATPANSTDRR